MPSISKAKLLQLHWGQENSETQEETTLTQAHLSRLLTTTLSTHQSVQITSRIANKK